jgi:hypothetical protein
MRNERSFAFGADPEGIQAKRALQKQKLNGIHCFQASPQVKETAETARKSSRVKSCMPLQLQSFKTSQKQ